MKCNWEIINIAHSGRKQRRGKMVNDPRYSPMFGAIIENWDPYSVQQFDRIRWDIINNSAYDWWHTSPVVQIGLTMDNTYEIETVNTIYELKALKDE